MCCLGSQLQRRWSLVVFVAELACRKDELVHLHSCVWWHWCEPLMRMLLNNGWCLAIADAAAASDGAHDANAAAVTLFVLMKNRRLWLRLRVHMASRKACSALESAVLSGCTMRAMFL